MQLTLFSTSACHLCDEAEALLNQAATAATQPAVPLQWERVDIANDEYLFERYGWLIPVVATAAGDELRWPFDLEGLQAFLSATQRGASDQG